MTGSQLMTTLTAQGATLHLTPAGKLLVRPATLLQAPGMRAAVEAQLPYLLGVAVREEIRRLIRPLSAEQIATLPPAPGPAATLVQASEQGDVEAMRQAAVQYLEAWQAWVQGGAA